ncbi:MAG TPA: Gfo/Idh/MocA family oxidoreductase [Terracidiphilus sp.]|nr:Gfo/Idh/MocA family oxidoreductase [Terracidiphilus sp.]
MTREVRLAFVGAGTVAEMHGRGVSGVPNVRLAGAYDVDRRKAKAITSRFGGRVFDSLEEVLCDRDVDAVHVLTPVDHHVSQAIACLRAGKHVLLEKPVANTHEELALLQSVAKGAGRVCMPAHNYIYAPSVRRAKRLVETGKLGQITSLWILYNIFHSEQAAENYGGVVRAVCTHHAYSVLYLLGRPRRVSAVASRIRDRQASREEQAMIVCEMESGAIANLWSSFAADDPTSDPWAVVYKVLGTNGGVSYSWHEAQFNDEGGPAWGMPCYEESFVEEIDHFVNQCILADGLPLSTLDDAADALSILTAAERSIAKADALATVVYGE